MPVFNRASLIADAIDSIVAQNHPVTEIIVVDDGSTDGSAEIAAARSEVVRCLHQEHLGVSAARNHGVEHAQGEFIAFLDSDDVWPADSLGRRADVLIARPELAGVFGWTQYENRVSDDRRDDGEADKRVLSMLLGSVLCRRSLFDEVGVFDESLEHSEDVDWVARVRASGAEIATIDDTTLVYRIHGGNMTFDVERNQASLLRALKKSIDRRREG